MKQRDNVDVSMVARVIVYSIGEGTKMGTKDERERCLAIVRAHAQIGGSGGYGAIETAILSGEAAPRLIEFGAHPLEPWIEECERREAERQR